MMVVKQKQEVKPQNLVTLYKKGNRTAYDVIYDTLTVLHKADRVGLTKNGMACKANFVNSQYRLTDEVLLKAGLVKERIGDGRTLKKPDHVRAFTPYYFITDKGLEFIQRYEKLTELVMVGEE